MKKILSIVMALAIVLTMASFPAFAEDAAIVPMSITSPFSPNSGYTLNGIIDGSEAANANYFRASVRITSTGTKGDDANLNFTVDFGLPYNITKLYTAFGGQFATGVAVWGSNDNATWTELEDLTLSAQRSRSDISHEGYYRYVKVEAYATKDNNPAILEVTFYGHADGVAKVTGITADDIAVSGGSLFTNSSITPDKASLVDGDISNSTVNTFTFGWSGTALTFEVTLPEAINLSNLAFFWGNTKGADNAYNVRPAKTYDVYVAGEDGVYGETPVYSHDDTTLTDTPRGTNRTDFVTFDTPVEGVKKVKVAVSNYYASGCLAIRELEIYKSTATTEPEAKDTTYTVNYVDAEGNPVATAKNGTGVVGNTVTETAPAIAGYKPDAPTKSITLVDGTNEIIFTYVPVDTATYTVKYVDEVGNKLADSKTGEGTEGEEITETAPNLIADGYFIAENAKTVTLAAGENEIVFTYKKVIKVSSVKFNPLNGTTSWTTGGAGLVNIINGALAPSGNDVTYTINSNATATPVGELIFTFDKTYAFDKMTAFWTNNDTNVDVYVSDNNENWGEPVYTGTTPATVVRGVKASEINLGGAEGQYIKVVFNKKFYVTLHEFTFEGGEPVSEPDEPVEDGRNPIELVPTATSAPASTSGRPIFYATDGDDTTFYANANYHDNVSSVNYQHVFDIGYLGTVDSLDILWGASSWGNTTPNAYKVEVSPDGTSWTQKKSYSGIYDITTGAATDTISGENTVFGITTNKGATNSINAYTQGNILEKNLGWTNVRYIRVTVTSVQFRLAIREVTVASVPNKDELIISKGGQIRFADAEQDLSAGLRFGASIIKMNVGIEGEYKYSEDATVKFGMFMIPKELLGEQTLTAYLANGVQDALEVPAKKILSQDDNFITFTAVLVDIPSDYNGWEIVAVPYMLKDGAYTYFDEMTRSYKGVAQSALETTYNPSVISAMADSEEKTAMREISYQLQYIQRGYDKPYTEQGERIIAKLKRGMNMQGLDASTWSRWDSHISTVTSSSTYQNIKNAGFDHVRIPVDFRNAADSSGNLNTSKMTTYVDKAVDAAIGQGLVVLLDFHGWADIMLTDFDYFVTVWTNLATYYKDKYPEDLIFELVNEPHSAEESDGDGGDLNMTNLVTLEVRTIEAIRAIDPDRFICLATAGWNGIWTLKDSEIGAASMFRNTALMNYQDTIVALHSYTPGEFTHQDMSWAGTGGQTYSWSDNQEAYEAAIKEELGYLVEFVEETGMHAILNEFGCNTGSSVSDADEVAYAKAVVSCIKDNDKIAYTWWEYEQSFGMTSNGSWKTHILNEVMAE